MRQQAMSTKEASYSSRQPGSERTAFGRMIRSRPFAIYMGAGLLYVLSFFLLDRISFSLRTSAGVSLKYLPDGLGMALLLRYGVSLAPLLALQPFFKSLWATYSGPIGFPGLILLGSVPACVYGSAAFLLRRMLRDAREPGLKEILRFVALVIPAAFVSAMGTVLCLYAMDLIPGSFLFEKLLRTWMGGSLGIMTMAPILLGGEASAARGRQARLVKKWDDGDQGDTTRPGSFFARLEMTLQIAAIVLLLVLVFPQGSGASFKHFYFCFIPVIWIALRHGIRGAAWGVLGVNLGMLLAFSEWQAPLSEVADAQLFTMTITLTSLFLGAAVSDRRKALSALLKSEARLREAQKMETVERLVGGVAHVFNNYLAVVIGYSEIALGQVGPGHAARGSLEEIRSAGEKAALLTDKLLTLSRGRVVSVSTLDLNEILSEMEGALRAMIGRNISLTIRQNPGPARIRANRGQVEQAVFNLVANACEAMPEGGILDVTVESAELAQSSPCFGGVVMPGSYFILSVSDTGRGMDIELQSRIFEPFFTTKNTAKGAGLGLSTVFGIMEQAGGKIFVQSEPGSGSVFRLFFRPAQINAMTLGLSPKPGASPG